MKHLRSFLSRRISFRNSMREILQMQVNRVKKLGSYHLPQAENPVWICSFTFREGETGSMDKVKKALLTEEENGNRENGEVQR